MHCIITWPSTLPLSLAQVDGLVQERRNSSVRWSPPLTVLAASFSRSELLGPPSLGGWAGRRSRPRGSVGVSRGVRADELRLGLSLRFSMSSPSGQIGSGKMRLPRGVNVPCVPVTTMLRTWQRKISKMITEMFYIPNLFRETQKYICSFYIISRYCNDTGSWNCSSASEATLNPQTIVIISIHIHFRLRSLSLSLSTGLSAHNQNKTKHNKKHVHRLTGNHCWGYYPGTWQPLLGLLSWYLATTAGATILVPGNHCWGYYPGTWQPLLGLLSWYPVM